jgi:uncharacterized membrane protein YbhN (UPF0104 family)
LVWRVALVGTVALGGLWTATHGVAGVGVGAVAVVLREVPLVRLLALTVIWFGGLTIYATVLAAALPGLGVPRGLLLNLSGSAIANVVPLGGAAATALNWRMVRGWGHSTRAFTTFCVLTNVLDVVLKLTLPLVAVATSAVLSLPVPAALWAVAGTCGVVLVAVLVLAALLRPGPVGNRGRGHDPRRWWTGSGAVGRAALAVQETAARARAGLVRDWPRLVPGNAVYVAAQVVLLDVSLRSVGLHVSVPVVLMAAAIERLGTVVALTPGGTGVAEIGTVAWLLASGLDPAHVVAGVLLYRVFLVGMEVPVGGLLLGAWAWRVATGRPERQVAA